MMMNIKTAIHTDININTGLFLKYRYKDEYFNISSKPHLLCR